MAMLMSVMSFAAEATATISFADKAQRTVYTTNQQVWEQNGIVVTNDKASSTTNVGDYANPARFYKGSKVTIQCTLGNIKKIEISNCGDNKYATPWNTNNEAAVSGTTATITPKSVSDTYTIAALNAQARAGQMVITYEVAEGGFVSTPTIEGEQYFKESTTVSMKAAEGLDIYYTVDGTEPTKASTPYTASFELTATTTVKAVAYDGENASEVVTVTFTKMQVLTCAEAAAITPTGDKYIVRGYVTFAKEYDTDFNNIEFFMADTKNGGEVLKVYRAVAVLETDKSVKAGAYVEVIGKLAVYSGTVQVAQGGSYTIIEAPVVEEPTIECKDALDFGAVVYTDEVEGQTLEVTGYNLTSDITVTLSDDVFAVDQTTLPAEGGELVVTPVSPLAAGTHTATLTLTSGEATAEVTLTIVAKDVYTITWSVNGEISTTSVVEGDKLVLPTAPEAPEACSEKVFVGWTAAEEVNEDGSEIEWVTAATAPTAAATYYAVFAVQEGEGGQEEVVDVLDRALTGVEGTTYASWADVSATSDAVYAGQSAGGNESIQLRSNNSNSGVISTTSGGKLAKVVVTWKGETAAGRTLNVYGSNTAYASPTDLYGDASGEKLGAIVCGTSTELVIEGDYAYVGLRSNSGAMYLDEIQITWTTGAAATYTDYSTTCEAEPEYEEIPLSVTDLEIEMDEQVILKGTAMMQSPKDITISLVVDASEANEDGTFNLTDESEITFMETPMTFISGVAMIDLESNMARAIVRVEFEGMYFEFTFDMTALVPAIDVVVDDATITVEKLDDGMGGTYENITVSAKWNESVLVIEGVEKAHEGFIQIKETFEVDGEEDWYIWMCMNGVITTVDNVLTVKGEFKNNFTGDVYNVTISGTLPSGATALENLDTTVAPAKAIVNGQLVIVKDGVQYNATGAVVK